jgi:hypothetical protein
MNALIAFEDHGLSVAITGATETRNQSAVFAAATAARLSQHL